MAGVGTLGGRIEELARQRDTGLVVATWVAFLLKILGGVLALALVQSWGRRLPRRPVLLTSWAAAILLVVYGMLQTATVALIAAGLVDDTQGFSSEARRWRLFLWEPWFLVWGLLLGLAGSVGGVARERRERHSRVRIGGEMDSRHAVRIERAQRTGDSRPEVAAVGPVPLVAEAMHQLGDDLGDATGRPTRLSKRR